MKAVPDTRPAKDAWAPGNYECLCANCRDSFIGDKGAMICADCAYNNGWRSIDSAPKDGSEILLFNSLGNRHIGRWGHRYLGDPQHDGWTWDGKQIGGYITHWRPLPEKPTLTPLNAKE